MAPQLGRPRAAAEDSPPQSTTADASISTTTTLNGAILDEIQEGANGLSPKVGAHGPTNISDDVQAEVVSGRDGRRASESRAMQLWDAKVELRKPHVEWMLQPWIGNKNYERKRVTPLGQSFVRSDTVGLVTTHQGTPLVSKLTRSLPFLVRVLNKFLRSRISPSFSWTSICINDGFASRRHRDSSNIGTSFIMAFGDYIDGNMLSWPEDDCKGELKKLKEGEVPRRGFLRGTKSTRDFTVLGT